MDGNTEPIIAVIGHPIAGNPSQFALERALQSLNLEWRVFSFDVTAEHLDKALDGLEVLGVRGVLIDESLAPVVGRWRATESDEATDGPCIDCLIRDDTTGLFRKHGAASAWFQTIVSEHAKLIEHDIQKTILIGDPEKCAAWKSAELTPTVTRLPRNLLRIEETDLIVIQRGDQEPADLEVEDWPEDDESILVVDFSEGHPDLSAIKSRGYKVITAESLRIGTLIECFRKWTSKEAPIETIHDAIEEYLAV